MNHQLREGAEDKKRLEEAAERRDARSPQREPHIMHQDDDIDPADFLDPEEFSAKRRDFKILEP